MMKIILKNMKKKKIRENEEEKSKKNEEEENEISTKRKNLSKDLNEELLKNKEIY